MQGSPFFFSPYEPVTLSVFGKLHEKCPKLEQPSKTELSDFKFMLKKGPFWLYPTLLCSSKWIIYCKNCDQTFFSYFFIFIVTVSFLLFFSQPFNSQFVLLPGKNAVEFKSLPRNLMHTDFRKLQKTNHCRFVKVWKSLKIRPCMFMRRSIRRI